MGNNKSFKYNYSAKEQEEIRSIRAKYQPKTEDKMDMLRRMDAGVETKGTIVSLVFGIVGCLTFGGGMSIVLVVGMDWFIAGLILGIIGIALMSLAYPLYVKVTRIERERIAPEILRISEELMQ